MPIRSTFVRAVVLVTVLVLIDANAGPAPYGPQPTQAANITVNSLGDEFLANGNCTLREAISSANFNLAFDACTAGTIGADTITIAVPGTITMLLAGKNEGANATGD